MAIMGWEKVKNTIRAGAMPLTKNFPNKRGKAHSPGAW